MILQCEIQIAFQYASYIIIIKTEQFSLNMRDRDFKFNLLMSNDFANTL